MINDGLSIGSFISRRAFFFITKLNEKRKKLEQDSFIILGKMCFFALCEKMITCLLFVVISAGKKLNYNLSMTTSVMENITKY